MIILGLILVIAGYLLPLSLLVTFGVILLAIGVTLEILGAAGYAIGGRRHYW